MLTVVIREPESYGLIVLDISEFLFTLLSEGDLVGGEILKLIVQKFISYKTLPGTRSGTKLYKLVYG